MATKEELEAELARTKAKLAAAESRARGAGGGARPITKKIDPENDIKNTKIVEKLAAAREVADVHDDSADAREPIAQEAQDLIVALRELNVGYSAHGLTLIPNKSFDTKVQHDGEKPKGDVFVWGEPCHPLDVAKKLAAGADVDTLTTIAEELEAKLENEATL